MAGVDVALVTYAELPDGDVDDELLVAALHRAGLSCEYACWDDPDARWPIAGMVLVRSPWDYHRRLAGFLAWADYVASVSELRNDAETIRWNSHKGYLLDLVACGVDVVPTRVVRAGQREDLGPGEWVVKPAVSIGADRTTRQATQPDLDELVATDDALVQPYLADIETRGELSIVCIDGMPTHVVRKVPAPGDFRTQEHHGAECVSVELTEEHRAMATAALDAVPVSTPLYARVDVADTRDGLLLMELELIEPTLWFRWHPPAADALAAAIAGQLTRSG